jgi:hypothetical protein
MAGYPHERQIEYWTSRAIEDFFGNEGYDVVVLPNSSRVEKVLPFDHLFAGRGIKVFGLQYKRLYKGSLRDYWKIDVDQYQQVQRFSWIFYGLSQVRSIRQRKNALHWLVLTRLNSLQDRVAAANGSYYRLETVDLGIGGEKVPYYRWGGFVQGLFGCTVGWRPEAVDELRRELSEVREVLEAVVDFYFVPLEGGPAIRLTPFVTDIKHLEEGIDFGLMNLERRSDE